jgi:hypothetical protein
VNTALKPLLALAALLLLGGIAAFLWLRPSSSLSALERDAPAAQPLETKRDTPIEGPSSLAAEDPASERSSMPKETKGAPVANKQAAAAGETEATVVAHIVDESLRPIADAWLRLADQDTGSDKSGARLEARTGSDGIATLHWKSTVAPHPVRFAAGAQGYAMVFPRGTLKPGETLHLGDLTLRPGGSVRGRVVDHEQHPVAGAQVVVSEERTVWGSNDLEQLRSRGPETWEGAPESKSDADGSFLVEGVATGMTRAWAKSETMRWAVSAPLEVGAGSVVRDVVLVLDPEEKADAELRDIEGIVVGPDDKPIARAKMSVRQQIEGSSWGSGQTTEQDGRFRVHPRERGVKIRIEFSDPDERYTHVKLEDVKPGTKDLVIRLEEPKSLVIAVRDESGPVEDFRVLWGSDENNFGARACKDEKHADGRAIARVPSASFWYTVEAPGHMPEKIGPLDGSKPPAEIPVKLRTIPGIHGRVLAGETPVQGAKLGLYQQPTKTKIEMNGFTTLFETNAETETTSGADGSFTLDLQSDGSFSILAEAEGYARAQYGPAQLESAKGLQELVIQLDAGGTLEGKVLMPPGRSPAGVIVGINRGDAHPFTQVVGPDGAFRFPQLTAGAWEMQRTDELFHGPTSTSTSSGDDVQAGTLRRDFSIAVGQTTHMDLDLRNSNPCLLEIELQHNGEPARAWAIVVWPKDRHTYNGAPPSAATDSNGRARIEVDDPGECSLTARPPAESGSEFEFHADVTLQRGPNSWSQNVHTGRVEGTINGWQPDAGTTWRLLPQNSYSRPPELRPDASGHFVVAMLAAGSITVQRAKGEGRERTWETVQTIELASGETKTIQVP